MKTSLALATSRTSVTPAALGKSRRAHVSFLSIYMQRVTFLAVVLAALSACAPKHEPVSIDKSQIDLTSLMVQDLGSPSNEENYYNLLYPGDSPKHPGTIVLFRLLSAAQPGSLGTNDLFRLADPLQTNREKLVALSGRSVQITDGRTLLATGRISGWLGGPGDWIELNCPTNTNSGIYLRGRYEVQVEDGWPQWCGSSGKTWFRLKKGCRRHSCQATSCLMGICARNRRSEPLNPFNMENNSERPPNPEAELYNRNVYLLMRGDIGH